MKIKTEVNSAFHCTLESAFKMPILGDATKIHTGYGLLPSVNHFSEDATWGYAGGFRMVYINKNAFYKEGLWAKDIVIERIENKYWKWEIINFEQLQMGFKKFTGEWLVEDKKDGTVFITYTYTLHSGNILIFPFHWMFTKLIWNKYMKHAMENIKLLAESDSLYIYK